MRYTDITTLLDLERRSRRRQRDAIRDRAREDIAALSRELSTLDKLVRELRHDRLTEATSTPPVKPLDAAAVAKRAERDRKRQETVRTVQASATKRIADIKAQIGQ